MKIYKIIFSLGILLPTLGFTLENKISINESALLICENQFDNFGNGKGEDFISPDCIKNFKQMSALAATKEYKESDEKKILFYSFRNAVIIERYSKTTLSVDVIAGSNTELKVIKSLDYDHKNKEILVLEENGDVLTYSSFITGNVAPHRILRHKDLTSADEISVDSLHDEIAVYDKKNKNAFIFSRFANINGRKENQKITPIKIIKIP